MEKKESSAWIIRWGTAVLFAVPITVLVLYLFYSWFVLADRNIIFLYDHDMGPRAPDTSPFSIVTSSRYWMSGLVAAGFVLLFYTTVHWLLGRVTSR